MAIGAAILFLSSRFIPLRVTKGILSGQEAGMATLGGLMETFYSPILERAKKDRIPILDLPNTFNPYKQLYISQIEPNKEGGLLIATGISHIVKKHDFETSESMIYSKTNSEEYIAVKNPGSNGWRVAYPLKP